MLDQEPSDKDLANATTATAVSVIRKFRGLARILFPLIAFGWLIREIAEIWGITGVVAFCFALGAISGFLISILKGGGIYQTYQAIRFGLLFGFLLFLILEPLLTYFGYDESGGPRKKQEARLAEVKNVIYRAAGQPNLPFDQLTIPVRSSLSGLSNNTSADRISLKSLAPLLQDPEPKVRAQAALVLGHFENLAPEVLPLLEPILNDPTTTTRAAALIGIAGLRPLPESVHEVITKAASANEPELRHAAELARKRLNSPGRPTTIERW